MRLIKFALLFTSIVLAACQASSVDTSQAAKFKLNTSAFEDSGLIPRKYTCQGDNVSPDLSWSGFPANTQSFALIVEDPDAPGGTFTHWVLFDLPANTTQLAEGAAPIGIGGNNGIGRTGYLGACPPSGLHRYYFRLYALDVPSLNLKAGASRAEVDGALKGHVIGTADLMGRYEQQ